MNGYKFCVTIHMLSLIHICALKFPRGTYYKALVRVPSNKQKEYEEFGRKVKQAYEDSKQRYGAVKICRILNDNGTSCSVKRVQRHMAEQGLRSVVVKKYNHRANHGSVPDDKVNICLLYTSFFCLTVKRISIRK